MSCRLVVTVSAHVLLSLMCAALLAVCSGMWTDCLECLMLRAVLLSVWCRIEKIGEDSVWDGGNVGNLSPDKYMQLVKLRSHVHKDVRKQLYGDADDKLFFDNLKV